MDKVGFGERAIVNAPDTTIGGSVMRIFSGKQTDTVFHRLHGKIVYVLSGNIRAAVVKDGKVSAVNVNAGTSFFVKPGLVHNFFASEDSVVIEFASSEVYSDDTNCIFKGTIPEKKEDIGPDDVMKISEDDKVTTNKSKKRTMKKKTTKVKKTKK